MIMKGNLKKKLIAFMALMFFTASFGQNSSKFKVVLDAGHGGKDYGAVYHGFIEKNIALDVMLKVGKILEKNSDIHVTYTRTTDVFIELEERPRIANRAEANLFVSIHCNGEAKKSAYGTETFIMGLTKNASNLEVAKKENSVITLEKDYKVKYAGFDPNNPESMISFQLIQEEHRDQSIGMASKIQRGFTDGLKRKNRGVKEGPFWVLHKTAMPSVLIELGFLSYKPEGEWLNSEKGKNELAESIAKSIIEYKKENFISASIDDYRQPAPQNDVKPGPSKQAAANDIAPAANGIVFKVQIAASGKDMETSPSNFKGLSNITKAKAGNLIKYYYGETGSYDECRKLLEVAKGKGYTSAFVTAFKDGKSISVKDAIKQ